MNPTHNRSPNPELATQSRSVLPPLDFATEGEPKSSSGASQRLGRARYPTGQSQHRGSVRANLFMLVKRLAEELSIDPDWVTPVQLVEQLAADTTLANATKKKYRAAIIWACKQPNFGLLDGERRAGLEVACAFNPRKHGAVREIVRNARASARAIPERDLRPILDALLSASLPRGLGPRRQRSG